MAAFVSGLLFGLSLIVVIGAQNALVLRQGVLRQHVGTLVGICTVSDAVLIAVGVAGAGALLTGRPTVLGLVRIAGAVFLFGYAALAVRRLLTQRTAAVPDEGGSTWAGATTSCLAVTWLNPAVYLDTVVLLGSVAATHGAGRWDFGIGAAVGSLVWFCTLGYGARALAPIFRRRRAWQLLDVFVAAVMVSTGIRVLAGA